MVHTDAFKMICKNNDRTKTLLVFVIFTTVSLFHTSVGVSPQPADHLVPPPLPEPQYLRHSKAAARPPVAQTEYAPYVGDVPAAVPGSDGQSGLMTRIARWFGFGPYDQQLAAASYANPDYKLPAGKEAYFYAKPQQQGKEPCNLCGKYPWVPMLPQSVQYNLAQQYNKDAWAQYQQQAPASPVGAPQQQGTLQHQQQQLPVRQRAVQFKFPSPPKAVRPNAQSAAPYGGGAPLPHVQHNGLAPIPIPQLSGSALPPLYKAQLFRPIPTTAPSTVTHNEQQLPAVGFGQQFTATAVAGNANVQHYTENVGAHSEVRPDRVIPGTGTATAPLSTSTSTSTFAADNSFEIIKSHQITDFVASIEYPATFVQSESIDLGNKPVPLNHKPAEEIVNTVNFRHENFQPDLDKHIPASQLLTEIGNFGELPQPQQDITTLPPHTYDETTVQYGANFEAQFQTERNVYEPSAADNFPSASSLNLTAVTNILSNEFFYTSTESPASSDTFTEQPTEAFDYNTARTNDQAVEFLPSIQTNLIYLARQNSAASKSAKQHADRDRETPKRFLDSPIQHGPTNAPRPFTRDPSNLDLRSNPLRMRPAEQAKQPVYTNHRDDIAASPWFETTVPPIPAVTDPPVYTSTFSSIDASGQFAGMSPPAPPSNLPQIIIPYTSKRRPRPFEPSRQASTTASQIVAFDKWTKTDGPGTVDFHEQQESKVVSSATEAPLNPRRTTKYLTKILASNLRELLRREHEAKNKSRSHGFDFSKLQKNIDDWTEQEYTSLSHRPSTPTIRGRSKHIPTAYLTTPSPTPRQFKTLNTFDSKELSTSINNLEPLIVDRGSKRFHYAPVESNHIPDDDELQSSQQTKSEPTSVSTTSATPIYPTTTTTTTTTEFTPYYVRATTEPEPFELWKKANVAISPQTMEKVYVVTPQPRFFPQRILTTSTPTTTTTDSANEGKYKSPRFLVRPTPGNGTHLAQSLKPSSALSAPFYKPENFGLMGLSAYVPAKPVEIIDGNSKVVTIVTPLHSFSRTDVESLPSAEWQKSGSTSKPTMSPSPR